MEPAVATPVPTVADYTGVLAQVPEGQLLPTSIWMPPQIRTVDNWEQGLNPVTVPAIKIAVEPVVVSPQIRTVDNWEQGLNPVG